MIWCPLGKRVACGEDAFFLARPYMVKNDQRHAAVIGAWALLITLATLTFVVPRSPDIPRNAAAIAAGVEQGWQYTNALNLPRRGLAVASNDNFVYAVGGMDVHGDYVAPVEVAAVYNDGTLSNWQLTSSLQEPRFYLAAAIIGDYIYAVGGATGPRGHENRPAPTVERAKIQPDGTLGPWQYDLNLTTARRGLQVVAIDHSLVAIGGYNGEFLRTSEHTVVSADGSLVSWTADPKSSNTERYIHSAAATRGRIYLLAGHMQSQTSISYGNVEITELNSNGMLRPWLTQPSLLVRPRFLATAVATPTKLWLIGGHDGQQQLAHVETAELANDGSVGRWRDGPPLNLSRSACAAVVAKQTLLVIGGAHQDAPVTSVEALRITSP